MENVLKNGFKELSINETTDLNGGVAPAVVFVAGIAVGYVVDGGIKYFTGKTAADWVAEGIKIGLDYIY